MSKKKEVQENTFSLSAILSNKKSDLDQVAILTHYLHNSTIKEYKAVESNVYKILDPILKPYGKIDTDGSLMTELFKESQNVPFQPIDSPQFTFIDLFAGMGGFRIAMQNQGGKCVFSSEINSFAKKTYFANFGELPFGDIKLEETKKYIPDNFDVLCAGFPCQPFSNAGLKKGFEDTRGTLFFDVADIIREKKPKAFFLENVKNLVSHDKGNTFRVISNTLKELGYSIHFKVMNGNYFVPQNRERIFIVGFRCDIYVDSSDFAFP